MISYYQVTPWFLRHQQFEMAGEGISPKTKKLCTLSKQAEISIQPPSGVCLSRDETATPSAR